MKFLKDLGKITKLEIILSMPLFLCLEPKQPELTWRYAEASAFPRTESIFTFYKN